MCHATVKLTGAVSLLLQILYIASTSLLLLSSDGSSASLTNTSATSQEFNAFTLETTGDRDASLEGQFDVLCHALFHCTLHSLWCSLYISVSLLFALFFFIRLFIPPFLSTWSPFHWIISSVHLHITHTHTQRWRYCMKMWTRCPPPARRQPLFNPLLHSSVASALLFSSLTLFSRLLCSFIDVHSHFHFVYWWLALSLVWLFTHCNVLQRNEIPCLLLYAGASSSPSSSSSSFPLFALFTSVRP